MLDIYPQKLIPRVMSIWSAAVILGPIVGPDPGRLADRGLLLALGVLHQRADRHPGLPGHLDLHGPRRRRAASGRSTSWASARWSLFIGGFQLMVDRGPTQDWFDSKEIWIEAAHRRGGPLGLRRPDRSPPSTRSSTATWPRTATSSAPPLFGMFVGRAAVLHQRAAALDDAEPAGLFGPAERASPA